MGISKSDFEFVAQLARSQATQWVFAVSLVLLHYAPVLGFIFLFISIWISLGAVIGRYHYALDVLAGAATAVIVFAACYSYL